MKKSKKNGFTLIEALLSLMVSLLVSSMVCMIFSVVLHILQINRTTQDQFAILQLRELCALSDCSVEEDQLKIELNHEEFFVLYDRHRLVKEKGYEILLEGIDDAYFIDDGGMIYLRYEKNDQRFSFEIT